MVVDWRKLYAENQAAIAAGGRVGIPGSVPPAAGAAAPRTSRWLPALGGAGVSRPGPSHGRPLVHVPPGVDPRTSAPLVCMLHGCTQDPATFAAATRLNACADRHGFVVVYPGQSRAANPQGCWNWFDSGHQRRETGEPAAIAAAVTELLRGDGPCTIDPGRVYVAGLSAGGAMAMIVAVCYPDVFSAVAVHSGLAYGAATDMSSALQVMRRGRGDAVAQGRAAHAAMGAHARALPSIVIHGSADRTVAPANAGVVLRQAMTANHLAAPATCDHHVSRPTHVWHGQADGGHRYTRSQWRDEAGTVMHELLEVDGLGHAWSGGEPGGSYTDPRGPSATEAICGFFALTGAVAD
jgi:poly(hydroxyalkanoate) depolymerase family esterase